MESRKPLVSIVIPLKKVTRLVKKELIPALSRQTFKDFEVILLPDKVDTNLTLPKFVRVYATYPKTRPADKRDFGVTKARGKILAFIDDDVLPSKLWLQSAVNCFTNHKKAVAVCGPGITSKDDSLRAQVSGYVWSSWIGAGGAGIYRCKPQKVRKVDDFPTFNLLVYKSAFNDVGGFSSKYWPGEDTKLCHELVYKLNKEIIYDPGILVYHKRRPVFLSHLRQISGYGIHRGYFVKILPKTSRRLGYFIPFLFVLGLTVFPPLALLLGLIDHQITEILLSIYLFIVMFYIALVTATSIKIATKTRNLILGLLLLPSIVATHLVFGFQFGRGLFKKDLAI
jgi:cellulose synthase/poly-beta-1,6-N-acetylglucosamine synthase-like glycosyltransferase